MVFINTLKPEQNGQHFSDDICVFLKENFYQTFTEVCSLWYNWDKVSIGSVNGLAPNRWQAITYSNDDPVCWCIQVSPGRNSLAPGKFISNFRHVIFKHILMIDGWSISCEITPIWMSLDFTDNQSTLVQVMAWCRRTTSHYLSHCWSKSLSPYGVTRPWWVNVSIKPCTAIKNL